MRLSTGILAAILALSVPAVAQDAMQPAEQAQAGQAAGEAQAGSSDVAPAAELTPEDFASRARISNQFEILSSTLAIDKASSDEVKAFAQMLFDDHSEAQPLLAAAAEGQGIELPTELDEGHQAQLAALEDLEGEAFDQGFVSAQVSAHEEAIALFNAYLALHDESPLNSFAANTLPKLQAHLEQAQQLAGNN